jgi:hypothetical protein
LSRNPTAGCEENPMDRSEAVPLASACFGRSKSLSQ